MHSHKAIAEKGRGGGLSGKPGRGPEITRGQET